MLPSIIQQRYAQAKAAFDRKEFGTAADGFTQVLAALSDQDVAAEAKQPPLSDLRTLAGGFQELAAKAAAPPPPPPAPVVVAPPPPPPAPVAPRIYTGGETGIVPPAIVNQALPPFPGQVVIPRSGKLEVVIDESGAVESAVMTSSVTQNYDAMVLAATRNWRYKPATMNGAPVKFRKTVQISIKLAS
jgi:protein TonB